MTHPTSLIGSIISASVAQEPRPSSPVLFRGEIIRSIERAARIGFTGIDLHVADAEEVNWRKIGEVLNDSGVSLSGIATGGILMNGGMSLSDADGGSRKRAIGFLKGLIDKAAEFGSIVVIGIVRGRLSSHGTSCSIERYMNLLESMSDLDAYASSAGALLALEAIAYPESDCMNDVNSVLNLMDAIGSKSVLVNLDMWHMQSAGEEPVEAIRASQGKLGCFHISGPERKCPSQTGTDLKPILTALRETGYKGSLSLEYTPCEEGSGRTGEIDEQTQDSYARAGLVHLLGQIALA